MSTIPGKVQQPNFTKAKTQIDRRLMNFPASWYIAMHSKDLGKKPRMVKLFGQSLVAWRDQNDNPVIMYPYCSHKGAHLAIGKVIDGCIQCPFHHWHYDSSGKCVFIPEVKKIPPLARQDVYNTVEKYGCIWVWYGSQTPLFPLPKFSLAENEARNYIFVPQIITINTPLQEAIENLVDYSHLKTVHQMKFSGPLQFTLIDEQQSSRKQSELPIQKEAWFGYHAKFPLYVRDGIIGALSRALGLAAEFSIIQVDSWPSGFISLNLAKDKVIYALLSSFTPIESNKTNMISWILYKKTGKFWLDRFYAALFTWRIKATVVQDVPIWNTINPDAGKVHVKDDWLLLRFRSFYQSWVDKVE